MEEPDIFHINSVLPLSEVKACEIFIQNLGRLDHKTIVMEVLPFYHKVTLIRDSLTNLS
jgi:hypothetical protein